MRGWLRVMAVAAVLMLGARPGLAAEHEHYAARMGWGVAAFGATLFYTPVKLVYAGTGGLTAGLAFALTMGDGEIVDRVLSSAWGGTYVVPPPMLKGDEPILF